MPTRLFGELAVGALFHFAHGDDFDMATYVKIDTVRARSQVGGDVVQARPEARVRLIGL